MLFLKVGELSDTLESVDALSAVTLIAFGASGLVALTALGLSARTSVRRRRQVAEGTRQPGISIGEVFGWIAGLVFLAAFLWLLDPVLQITTTFG